MKGYIASNRSTLVARGNSLETLPTCPICGKYIENWKGDGADMHEWLITRGDAERAPFDERMKIFVAVNCVLIHPGPCHLKAQHEQEGKQMCLDYILKYHTRAEILRWLDNINLDVVKEARNYIEQ